MGHSHAHMHRCLYPPITGPSTTRSCQSIASTIPGYPFRPIPPFYASWSMIRGPSRFGVFAAVFEQMGIITHLDPAAIAHKFLGWGSIHCVKDTEAVRVHNCNPEEKAWMKPAVSRRPQLRPGAAFHKYCPISAPGLIGPQKARTDTTRSLNGLLEPQDYDPKAPLACLCPCPRRACMHCGKRQWPEPSEVLYLG
jgi:hypothetical protein